jgi:hypothetical protein
MNVTIQMRRRPQSLLQNQRQKIHLEVKFESRLLDLRSKEIRNLLRNSVRLRMESSLLTE